MRSRRNNCRKKNGKPNSQFPSKECPLDHVLRSRCCVPCTKCSPGYQPPSVCTGACNKCPQFPHRTFSSEGLKCTRCRDCEGLGLTYIRNCTDVSNSICGIECRDKGLYYDHSLLACRPSAVALREVTTDATTSLPDVLTGCTMHQSSSKSNDCITLRPPGAGLFPITVASGVALLVCALLLFLVVVGGLLVWYIRSRKTRVESSRNMSASTIGVHTRRELVDFRENDYAEISESAVPSVSSNSVRTEDQRNHRDDTEVALTS